MKVSVEKPASLTIHQVVGDKRYPWELSFKTWHRDAVRRVCRPTLCLLIDW